MWTPKRIVLFTGCFLAFFLSYLGYAWTAIGRMDGLPPLPEMYWPADDGEENPIPVVPRGDTPLTKRIKQAFGPNCEELKRSIRLDLQSRSMVLCAGEFKVEGGRVLLMPVSIAMFSKDKNDGKPPEISTLKGRIAWLTFDRPVSNFSEIASRKVVEAEIHSRIEIINNRRKPEHDEDLHLSVTTGPLYYRESTHRIWTHDYVTLTDHKSKPKPHVIKGKGMEMELHTEAAESVKPNSHKPRKESISGLNWVVLHSAVEMDLYVDGKGGLMSGKQDTPAPAAKQDAKAGAPASAPVVKSHMHITTPGQFRYDVLPDHDLANFDVAPPGPVQPMRQPQHVDVVRYNENGQTDHLVCQHLTLRLRRKANPADKPPAEPGKRPERDDREGGAEIETIHATATKREVVLTSDAERLIARGNDFFHDTVKGLTILKGEPEMEAEKDDSKIFARELHIQDVKPPRVPGQPEPKPYQNIMAKGPGHIHMVDSKQKPQKGGPGELSGQAPAKKTTHAYWQDLLTSTKDNGQDLLVLTGNARFVDEEAGQSLKADLLKVWLEEADKSQSTPATPTSARKAPTGSEPGQGTGALSGRRPRHIEAIGNVVARSRDMNIHDTRQLVVWFKDVPAPMHLPPGSTPPAQGQKQPAGDKRPAATTVPGGKPLPTAEENNNQPPIPQVMPKGPPTQRQTSTSGGTTTTGPVLPAQDNRPPARPFDVMARSIEARVLRSPGTDSAEPKNTIDELWCEGSVAVRQEPAKPDEKATDIKGDTLKMTNKGADLYYLVVTGDLAELQTDKIYIIGPEVNIDQSTNKAWVYGDGCMKMDSATNFQGEKLDKPVPLTVHWSKSMLFNGSSAEYHGNIQAVQQNARLACQRLHVFFDRTISLKEGNKSDDPAKVRELVCDRDVRIEDSTYEGDKLVKYQCLISPGVQMVSQEPDEDLPVGVKPVPAKKEAASKGKADNVVYASGPGTLRLWEPSSGDEMGPASGASGATPKKPPAKPAGKTPKKGDGEMKLTYVEFQKRMDGNSKTNTALFWENVRVLNLPSKKPDLKIDLDQMLASDLPEEAVYLRCDRLKVLDHPTDGQPNKQMEAHGKVYVQGREFYARAEMATYNQRKEQVIFFGGDGYATFYKVDVVGGKPQVLEGKKIIYNRATKVAWVYGGTQLSGATAPAAGGPPKPTTQPANRTNGSQPPRSVPVPGVPR